MNPQIKSLPNRTIGHSSQSLSQARSKAVPTSGPVAPARIAQQRHQRLVSCYSGWSSWQSGHQQHGSIQVPVGITMRDKIEASEFTGSVS